MPEAKSSPPVIAQYVAEPLRVGDPDVVGSLAVFPVFGPPAVLSYIAFVQASASGLQIKERDGGASVNDLIVTNPTGLNVLLYEGEEVLGAQQNRTFDVSVLVPAHGAISVPVSCVEAGRWDGSRHGEALTPAPQAAYPALRRMKNAQARAQASMGAEARADQSAVWQEVASKQSRHGVASDTGAMHDVFEHRRGRLGEMVERIGIRDEQCGALVAVGGRLDVLDYVSRPDVFAALHAPLVQGYALDALERRARSAPTVEEAQDWLDRAMSAPVTEQDGIGMGRDVRFEGSGAAGAGLVRGMELIQLTAFADAPAESRTAIRRPSRRRH